MTNSKWIRRALLGGVAMTVMAAGAQADDLSALKAQIESLQARVNTIEARGAALPEGVSFLTVARGHKGIKSVNEAEYDINAAPEGRGMTIAVTPTADLPAPATEITISGYVRNLAIYLHTNNAGASDNEFRDAARGNVTVKSKTDTAVGQIRTTINFRGDFAVDGHGHDTAANVRVALGEWDFMPNWTLKAGHGGQIAALTNVSFAGVTTPYGIDSSRHSQLGVHYTGGPLVFGFGIENPTRDVYAAVNDTTTMPDFAAYAQFNAPGGHSLRVVGNIAKVVETNGAGTAVAGHDTGWLFGVGAKVNAGMFGFNAGFAYSKGMGDSDIINGADYRRLSENGTASTGSLAKVWGVQANATFGVNEATTLYIGGGYYNYTSTLALAAMKDHGYKVTGGIAWRPVSALQVALEGSFGKDTTVGAGSQKAALGAVGFWFFF